MAVRHWQASHEDGAFDRVVGRFSLAPINLNVVLVLKLAVVTVFR